MAPRDVLGNPSDNNGFVYQPGHPATIEKIGVSGALANRPPSASERLKDLARDVRRIGDAYRSDPESIAIQKDLIAHKLAALALEIKS